MDKNKTYSPETLDTESFASGTKFAKVKQNFYPPQPNNVTEEAPEPPPAIPFKEWKQQGDNNTDSLVVYKVTNSVPLYYALRKIEGENCTYYYFKEELKEGETTAENPNRGINFQGAFNAAVGGDLSQWTRWDNADAPQKAKVALIPTVLSGSTVTFKASNLDILPISEWQKVDVTQETVEGWKRYQYKVNGLLITEYDNSTFYYHDKKSQEPAKAWVEFVPKRGESNTVDIDLNTSDFAQTPTRLSDAEVQANRASAANKAVENMVSWYQTNPNHYKKEYRRYQAENPEFAKRISGAVLTSYQDEGKKAMLVTVIAVASPLILVGAIEAGAYAGANLTREGVYQFAKELLVEEVLTTPVINAIEALTGLPLSTFADIKDAKELLKGAWHNLINSSLFKKTIDDNFEAIKTAAEKKQKNGGRSSEVDVPSLGKIASQNPVLAQKMENWELKDCQRFEADFALAPKQALDILAADENLLLVWKNMKYVKNPALRRDINFLKGLQEIQADADLQKHIFKGDYKPTPSNTGIEPSGVHHHEAISSNLTPNDGDVRIKAYLGQPIDDQPYQATIEMFSTVSQNFQLKLTANQKLLASGAKQPKDLGWTSKKTKSTFFPANWDKDRTIEEIACAFFNKKSKAAPTPNSNMNFFEGRTESGLRVEFVINPSGKLETVYPIFPQ